MVIFQDHTSLSDSLDGKLGEQLEGWRFGPNAFSRQGGIASSSSSHWWVMALGYSLPIMVSLEISNGDFHEKPSINTELLDVPYTCMYMYT